jgi:subtilisin-like proprotein convertase family protein
MRRLLSLLLLFFLAGAAQADETRGELLRQIDPDGRGIVRTDRQGRLADFYAVRYLSSGTPVEAASRFAERFRLGGDPREELREPRIRESLSGTVVEMTQFLDGLEVIGGRLLVQFDHESRIVSGHQRLATAPAEATVWHPLSAEPLRPFAEWKEAEELERRPVWLNVDGDAVPAWEILLARGAIERYAAYLSTDGATLLRVDPLYHRATQAARVFLANPVRLLNDPSLRDHNDSATAVPFSAYSDVVLEGLEPGATLTGPHVRIVDIQSPSTPRADPRLPLMFDRSQPQFEEVMAYFHIDRSQRYLQSLGFTGSRQLPRTAIRVDAHAGTADNSFFVPGVGSGTLYFGDGGVDDAEDPDILLHEYAHAIQEAAAPGAFGGAFSSEGRAMGEGFGDYWAFSDSYPTSLRTGRDPFCVGDWDARCGGAPSSNCAYPVGANCLRRVDSIRTHADFSRQNQPGTEHRNGEIWSSALRRLYLALVERHGVEEGKRRADAIIVESFFGMPPSPSFATAGRRMLQADLLLHGGMHRNSICSAMTAIQVLGADDCALPLRGELTHFPSNGVPVEIPDADLEGITVRRTITDTRLVERIFVGVEISHPRRADLRLTLIAPNGATVQLQSTALTDSGRDLDVVYGVDVEPLEPLGRLHGISAAGEWKLQIVDAISRDTGRLISWNLIIEFAGETTLNERPAGRSQIIPVAAHLRGALDTDFRTDLHLVNRSSRAITPLLLFTPSGRDGRSDFSAMRISIEPNAALTLVDVVRRLMLTSGSGSLQILEEGDALEVGSRTYHQSESGTYGQSIPPVREADQASRDGEPLQLIHLRSDLEFRTNIGLTEGAGSPVRVELRLFDRNGIETSRTNHDVPAFSHLQFPLEVAQPGRYRGEIRLADGAGLISAYASIVDNRSADPVFIPARTAFAGGSRIVPAVIRGDGAAGTRWRSEVIVANTTGQRTMVELELVSPGERLVRQLSLEAGEVVSWEDVLADLFARPAGFAQLQASLPAGVDLLSRGWNDGAAGSFGQLIPAIDAAEALGAGETGLLMQMQQSENFRTNVALVESGGSAATAEIDFFSAAGALLMTIPVALEPFAVVQFNIGQAGISGGSLHAAVRHRGGNGRLTGYASVVDNLTGDPVCVPLRRRP